MHNLINDIYVIIRSVGERTEQACFNVIAQLFPVENIAIVRETPFSKSIRESFNTAIERNLPWTLCIDADVLIDLDQLPELISKTKEIDKHIFEIQGLILDKFIPVWRPAGNHLYRTSLMEKAIACIPEEGSSLRPETDMLTCMTSLGYPWMQFDVNIGLHDFEQYYEDIYRKCFLQAHKHEHLTEMLEAYWTKQSYSDTDFLVAILGLQEGKLYHEKIYIDKNFLAHKAKQCLKNNKITEKDVLSKDNLVDIHDTLKEQDSFTPIEIQETIFPQERWHTLNVSSIYCPGELRLIHLSTYNITLWSHPDLFIHHSSEHEDLLSNLINNVIKSVNVFIDVEAQHGFFSLLAAKSNPSCKVIAGASSNGDIAIIEHNMAVNHISNISTFNSSLPEEAISSVNLLKYSDASLMLKMVSNRDGLEILGLLNKFTNYENTRLIIKYDSAGLSIAGYSAEKLSAKLQEYGYDIFILNNLAGQYYRYSTEKKQEELNAKEDIYWICIHKEKSSNIIFFSHSGQLQGAERSLVDLVEQLVQYYSVLCTIYLPAGPSAEMLKKAGAAVHRFEAAWWGGPSENEHKIRESLGREFNLSFSYFLKEFHEIQTISPDILCTNTMVIPWGAIAALLLNRPHFWMINEFGEADHQIKFLFSIGEIIKIIKQASTKVITRSNAIKDSLYDDYPNHHIETIYRSIQKNLNSSFAKNQTTSSKLRLYHPGTIKPSKGQKDAILAVLNLLNQGLNIELIFTGNKEDLSYFNELENLVNGSSRQDKIYFLPFQENVLPFYENTDIVLVCSINEAFSRIILESMMMKKPVIATNTGGNPELIQENITGFMYDPGNIDLLAQHIKRLYVDRNLLISFGENAFNFAEVAFTHKNFSGRYYDLFLEFKEHVNIANSHFTFWVMGLFIKEWHNQQSLWGHQLAERDAQLAARDAELANIYSSKTYRFSIWLRSLRLWIAPSGSIQAKLAKKILTVVRKIKLQIK